MKNSALKNFPVSTFPETALALYLSILESKIDLILSLVQNLGMVSYSPAPSLNVCSLEHAIRSHIQGDRGPMDELEKLYKESQNA